VFSAKVRWLFELQAMLQRTLRKAELKARQRRVELVY